MPDYLNFSKIKANKPEYFTSSGNKEADRKASEAVTNNICNEFNCLFSGMAFWDGTFSCR